MGEREEWEERKEGREPSGEEVQIKIAKSKDCVNQCKFFGTHKHVKRIIERGKKCENSSASGLQLLVTFARVSTIHSLRQHNKITVVR